MSPGTPSVFHYLDYREFLKDFYASMKTRRGGFSYRSFSMRAGLGSPNYLKVVIEGQRNLSADMAEKFADGCRLSGKSKEFFLELVRFTQTESITERSRYLQRLAKYTAFQQIHQLELAQADYYSKWYIPAIYEMIACPAFNPNPDWIAQALVPKIQIRQAEHALRVLAKLELIEQDDTGKITKRHTLLSTGAQTRSMNAVTFHRAMLERASSSIDVFPATERDLGALTLTVGPEGLQLLKTRLQEIRSELMALSEKESAPERVVQVNTQVFPLTRALTSVEVE